MTQWVKGLVAKTDHPRTHTVWAENRLLSTELYMPSLHRE